MKIVKLRLKRGLKKRITETQKLYTYICPIDTIEINQWVLVDVTVHKFGESFAVGRIEQILDYSNKVANELRPYGFVITPIPIKDFESRCKKVKNMKYKQLARYDQVDKKKKKQKKQ